MLEARRDQKEQNEISKRCWKWQELGTEIWKEKPVTVKRSDCIKHDWIIPLINIKLTESREKNN